MLRRSKFGSDATVEYFNRYKFRTVNDCDSISSPALNKWCVSAEISGLTIVCCSNDFRIPLREFEYLESDALDLPQTNFVFAAVVKLRGARR